MTDIPDGLSVETVWLVEVPYTPEAPERRPLHRQVHLGRIATLIRDGTVIEAGGAQDWSKAVLLMRAATADEALAIIEEDVYTLEGVWHSPTARPFGRSSWSRPPAERALVAGALPACRAQPAADWRQAAGTRSRAPTPTSGHSVGRRASRRQCPARRACEPDGPRRRALRPESAGIERHRCQDAAPAGLGWMERLGTSPRGLRGGERLPGPSRRPEAPDPEGGRPERDRRRRPGQPGSTAESPGPTRSDGVAAYQVAAAGAAAVTRRAMLDSAHDADSRPHAPEEVRHGSRGRDGCVDAGGSRPRPSPIRSAMPAAPTVAACVQRCRRVASEASSCRRPMDHGPASPRRRRHQWRTDSSLAARCASTWAPRAGDPTPPRRLLVASRRCCPGPRPRRRRGSGSA